jgi:hypothetical protein
VRTYVSLLVIDFRFTAKLYLLFRDTGTSTETYKDCALIPGTTGLLCSYNDSQGQTATATIDLSKLAPKFISIKHDMIHLILITVC